MGHEFNKGINSKLRNVDLDLINGGKKSEHLVMTDIVSFLHFR